MMGRSVPVYLLSDTYDEKYLNSIKSTSSVRQPIIQHVKAIDRLIMQGLNIWITFSYAKFKLFSL